MTPKRFSLAELFVGSGYTPLYAVPSDKTALLKNLTISNISGADESVTLHIVPFGGAPAAGNALLHNVTVPANAIFDWQGLHVLEPGDELLAVGQGLVVIASGTEL